jgi:hypothetical protein
MTDIVERLREVHGVFPHVDLLEAADAIERLRFEGAIGAEIVNQLRSQVEELDGILATNQLCTDAIIRQRDQARAENERLRAELEWLRAVLASDKSGAE